MTQAVLLFDYGRGVGMGHQRRMEALAIALADRGLEVHLSPSDSTETAAVVVVDSYMHRADEPRGERPGVLAAVDDLSRDLDVDLIIDPNPGAQVSDHHKAREVLAGAAYALIDPALASLPVAPVQERVRAVLVSCGAADSAGTGQQIAGMLRREIPDCDIRLAVGPWGSPCVPDGVTAVRTLGGLASVIRDVDVVVTAGGVTLLESLVLGRPTVAMVLAENQRRAVDGAAAAGAALVATPDTAARSAAKLAADASLRSELSATARTLVDGSGTYRVADALSRLIESRSS